ncbi:MAG: alpha/beta hydrolase family protein [Nitrospirales bacterium]
MWRRNIATLVGFLIVTVTTEGVSFAQSAPLDLWTDQVMAKIRDPRTLNVKIIPRVGYFEVFYNSEIGDADWADSSPPYEVHQGDTIRIHGYLATPLAGGPYPGIVIGHGHHGHGSPEVAMALAAFGYVALSMDGPRAGQSTGGPQDTEQAWISVEEFMNIPSPAVGYLYHYAYAGMRGLTLLEYLSTVRWFFYSNPLRIDRNKLGVIGASMGGQFTYYINGVDPRVKAAVALAVAGDWQKLLFYPGAWLYHGVYYYTRDGVPSGEDHLNTISDVCLDPTAQTFLNYFDPISYAPTQHAPLLTIIGTHDQYFTVPAINTTYDRVASANADLRFRKNILLVPNGKHGILEGQDDLETALGIIWDIHAWFRYSFNDAAAPPETPTVTMRVEGEEMVFTVAVVPGSRPIQTVRLWFATQIDTFPETANDFASIRLELTGGDYVGRLPIGAAPPSGPPARPDNIFYFATVRDEANFTITSKMYYKAGELAFCDDFVPLIEHFPGDDFSVQPPPSPNRSCPPALASAGQ